MYICPLAKDWPFFELLHDPLLLKLGIVTSQFLNHHRVAGDMGTNFA